MKNPKKRTVVQFGEKEEWMDLRILLTCQDRLSHPDELRWSSLESSFQAVSNEPNNSRFVRTTKEKFKEEICCSKTFGSRKNVRWWCCLWKFVATSSEWKLVITLGSWERSSQAPSTRMIGSVKLKKEFTIRTILELISVSEGAKDVVGHGSCNKAAKFPSIHSFYCSIVPLRDLRPKLQHSLKRKASVLTFLSHVDTMMIILSKKTWVGP